MSNWWLMSRKAVGSSNSKMPACWARALAMMARWRSPPDSSRKVRLATGRMSMACIAWRAI